MLDFSGYLFDSGQVRQMDAQAVRAGIPQTQLTQRAGEAPWGLLPPRWPAAQRHGDLCAALPGVINASADAAL